MKTFVASVLICLLASISRSQEPELTHLVFSKSDVRHVLMLYERLTGKLVFARPEVIADVTILTPNAIPRAEAVDLIRKTLLERYGIELSTTDRSETLVAWSKDPRYPHRSDEPKPVKKSDANPRTRVRIINQ